MNSVISMLTLLAADPPKAGGDDPSPFASMLPMMALLAVFFYLIVVRPASRDRKKHEEMVANLEKNTRVVTIGGIIGTVVSVSEDKKEITLKVDDNARVRVIRSAISTVLKDSPAGETNKDKK